MNTELVLVLIALVFLVGIVENFGEFAIKVLRKTFKKYIGEIIGYVLIFIFAYSISMFGDFKFFSYLGIDYWYNWMDWAMSAFVISAGTGFLERKFDIINAIPSIVSGIRVGKSKKENNIKKFNYDEDPNEPTI